MKTKNFENKSQRRKKLKGGPFSLVRFWMLRLKSKKKLKWGPFTITSMRFQDIRLVEQTEQKIRHFESVLKRKVTVIVGLFY